jgi:glycosyltransferase involved in cell wall biosynthesis
MRVSVVVNSYNYRDYVCEAVDSVLRQTRSADEIIVVDDGSTDGSQELLRDRYRAEPRVQLVCKSNAGQLSALNAAYLRSSGDVVFFLDSDDAWDEDYLEKALAFYKARPECDFLIVGRREFGAVERVCLDYPETRDFGFTVLATLYGRVWVGGPTSTLSARRWVLDAFMPVPCEHDWRVRADNCLVWGAGLVGARKAFLALPLVSYRVHGANNFYGCTPTPDREYRYRLARTRLFGHVLGRVGYVEALLLNLLELEFRSAPKVGSRLKTYRKVVKKSGRPFLWRLVRAQRLRVWSWSDRLER